MSNDTQEVTVDALIDSLSAEIKLACYFEADDVSVTPKKADAILSALKGVKELETEVRLLKQPDMFWDVHANESCSYSPEEIAELQWDNAHPDNPRYGTIEVQEAVRLKDKIYLWKRIDRIDCSLKDFELTEISEAQDLGIHAAMAVEAFARSVLNKKEG